VTKVYIYHVSEQTQLTYLSPEVVCALLPEVLSRWHTSEEVTLNEDAKKAGLNYEWLTSLWKYLQTNFRNSLNRFENMHILPFTESRLIRLSRTMAIMAKADPLGSCCVLSEQMLSVCNKLGISIIHELEPEVRKHPNVWNTYVLPPSVDGFLTALTRLQSSFGRQQVVEKFAQINGTSRQSMRQFLTSERQTITTSGSDKLDLLRHLPIFLTVDGSGRRKSRFVSVNEVAVAKSRDVQIPVACPRELLDLDDECSRKLATALGTKSMSTAEIISTVYLPSVLAVDCDDDVRALMLFVCENLRDFERTAYCQQIVEQSRKVAFLSSQTVKCLRPCDLFNSHDDLLARLFCADPQFPTGKFANGKYQQALIVLGLKSYDSVTPTDIIAVAQKLSSDSVNSENKLKSAEALIELLNRRSKVLHEKLQGQGNSLLKLLFQMRWVTVSNERPQNYPASLRYGRSCLDGCFALPSDVRSVRYAHLIGSVRPLVDTQHVAALAAEFNWNAKPRVNDVAQHLKNTLKCFCPDEKLPVLQVMLLVCRYLEDNPAEIDEWLTIMGRTKWIWNGESFSDNTQIVLGKDCLDMRPYRYTLPQELQRFGQLWARCKFRETSDLTEVLEAIHEAQNTQDTEVGKGNNDVQLAVAILNHLSKQPLDASQLEKLLVPIKTSDGSLAMKYTRECVYCDKEWYERCSYDVADRDDGVAVVHELLPVKTAEFLNIPSLVSRSLGAQELDIAYGQTEPLTRRLKNILADYTDGLSVLKELIQNADDAEAFEIKFLYDERSNDDRTKIILDQGMKTLQGPTLWTYNDAAFTDDDFTNITKLSGATKQANGNKIGRFGLGFNSVYNLTDVPSFISRNFIVFFDPHTTYLGKALPDRNKPGIKLNIETHMRKVQSLTDQFYPYKDVFDCDLSVDSRMTSYKGTLFRFPLRTPEQAAKSEISGLSYSDREVRELLEVLHRAAHHLLIYTQHLKKICVFHLSAGSSSPKEMTEWFSAERSVLNILRDITSPPSSKGSGFLSSCNSLVRSYNERRKSLHKQNKSSNKPNLEISCLISVSVKSGDVFVEHDRHEVKSVPNEQSIWLVTCCMAEGEAFDMSLSDSGLVPIGGVAIKLDMVGSDLYRVAEVDATADSYGMVYCFMPLPIKYPLPVHINGYFAVHSSRTQLYGRGAMDKDSDRARWNIALMRDAVCKSYCTMLEDLTKLCRNKSSYAAWPTITSIKEANSLVAELIQALYGRICSPCGPRIVWADDGWVHFDSCLLLCPRFRQDKVAELVMRVLKQIVTRGIVIVDPPVAVIDTMLQTGAKETMQSKLLDENDFICEWFLPNIAKVDTLCRDRVVVHCLTNEKLQHHLHDCKCIPVSRDGTVMKCIPELIHPESELASLFNAVEERFPLWHVDIAYNRTVNEKLVSLGMKIDKLPWEELVNRCYIVEAEIDSAPRRTPVIIQLMDANFRAKNIPTPAELDKCTHAKFLPILGKPKNFPLTWKGDLCSKGELTSCIDAYLSKHLSLVGSHYAVVDERIAFSLSASKEVKRQLGLSRKKVELVTVVRQVDELISARDSSQIEKIYDEVFAFLDKRLNESVNGSMSSADLDLIMSLADKPCIRIQTGVFMIPRHCAAQCSSWSPLMLPYLAVVSSNKFDRYPGILKKIGVQDVFSLADYADMLRRIDEKAGDGNLDEDDLHAVLHVVNECIYTEVSQREDDKTVVTRSSPIPNAKDLPIPNAAGKMCSADTLWFNNCPWLVMPNDVCCCHPQIPFPVAKAIGIKTLRKKIVSDHRFDLQLKRFGQSEPLERRIKRILDNYSSYEDILKEMLQNADDSKATEIHFVLDSRTLPCDRVFDDSWKAIQGPALCVYNNRSFTKADLRGIQELGLGSKGHDAAKTGQYGVGFNCVYHITDVPSFITTLSATEESEDDGNNNKGRATVLCAFDPNCAYVPDADDQYPGGIYKVDDELRKNFCDVFAGYLETHFDVSKTGTTFRLPLRTVEMAGKSQLSSYAISVDKIKGIFKKFKSEMPEMLLFANSVEEIHFEETDGSNDNEVRSIYKVQVKLSPESKKRRADFLETVREVAKKLDDRQCMLSDVQMREVCYDMTVTDSDGMEQDWCIVQRFGFQHPQMIAGVTTGAFERRELSCLPLGGVAYLQNAESSYISSHKSRLFCFLPLPCEFEDLPVSINGHFVLDHESRRDLWTEDQNSYRFLWNRGLMEDVVAPAYGTLMNRIRDRLHNKNALVEIGDRDFERYFALFPSIGKSLSPHVKFLTTALYRYIGEENFDLLPVLGNVTNPGSVKWIGPLGQPNKRAYFDDLDALCPEPCATTTAVPLLKNAQDAKPKKEKPAVVLRNALTRCGFVLFRCPMRIHNEFIQAEVDVKVIDPQAVISFFASHTERNSQCKIGRLPARVASTALKDMRSVKAILKFCVSFTSYKEHLVGLPLLVTEDEHLTVFDHNVRYVAGFSELAPHKRDLFIHHQVVTILKLDPNKDTVLCKRFELDDLVGMLPGLLPVQTFFGSDKTVDLEILDQMLASLDGNGVKRTNVKPTFVKAVTADAATRCQHWLTTLWSFVASLCPSSARSPQDEIASTGDFNKVVASLIAPLADWCLLPVQFSGKTMLVPVGRSREVLITASAFSPSPIDKYLDKIGVARSSDKHMIGSCENIILSLVRRAILGSAQQPDCVMLTIQRCMKCTNFTRTLSKEEGKRILLFFSDHIKQSNVAIEKKALKELPWYETIYNAQIALNQSRGYVIPSSIPGNDLQRWTESHSLVFLKEDADLRPLLDYVECSILSVADVYCKFIFDNFAILSPEAQYVHLNFVRNRVLKFEAARHYETDDNTEQSRDELDKLKQALQKLAFLPSTTTDSTRLLQASQIYDDSEEVFAMMLQSEYFPPSPYDLPVWRPFLRICGLHCEVSDDDFLNFALQIESSAAEGNDDRILHQSQVLLDHFVKRDFDDSSFLRRLCNVAFIAPQEISDDLTELCPLQGSSDASDSVRFISFVGSPLSEHQTLTWTVQTSLPSVICRDSFDQRISFEVDRQHSFEWVMQQLGVALTPAIDAVARHASNMCMHWQAQQRQLAENQRLADRLQNCVKETYKFLWRNVDELTNLTLTPCHYCH
jgi:sacsin